MPRLYFEESPIIAAVKTVEELNAALRSDVALACAVKKERERL